MLKAFVKVLMISVVLALIIAGLSYSHNAPPKVNPAAAASTPGSVAQPELSESQSQLSGNPAHDYLVAHPATRAQVLAKAVGEGCKGRSAFYQAITSCGVPGMPARTAWWSVKCTNGKSYSVSLFPDGRSSIMDCALLEAVHAGHCFTKMNDDSCVGHVTLKSDAAATEN
jgi:hypothetical protein